MVASLGGSWIIELTSATEIVESTSAPEIVEPTSAAAIVETKARGGSDWIERWVMCLDVNPLTAALQSSGEKQKNKVT